MDQRPSENSSNQSSNPLKAGGLDLSDWPASNSIQMANQTRSSCQFDPSTESLPSYHQPSNPINSRIQMRSERYWPLTSTTPNTRPVFTSLDYEMFCTPKPQAF
ncbi:hypothetical protein PGTUg99_036189 [Puccinia graminis f. sp. tritici]|uniref:Uncharacterized protein n=1 Tax=Puccinia graminis f. sp. tritici TaxID=56615 RepID=A0A5B0SLR4_PUCGR|nr:hypothetical protein PGTUg99_036189 [Puccinia graminis f. sp. tritici]